MPIVQLAASRIFSFRLNDLQGAITPDSMRNYAIEHGLMHIEPIRLTNIEVKISIFPSPNLRQTDYIRIFYFKNLAAYQSSLIYFTNTELTITPQEDPFWVGNPVMIESIGFAHDHNGLQGDIQIKASIYKKWN